MRRTPMRYTHRISRAQKEITIRQVRGGDAESFAQVPPKERWHDPHRIEMFAAHTQKPDLQGKTELELRSPAFLDDPGFLSQNWKTLHLEGRQLGRQLTKTQKCRLPAVPCAPPSRPHNTPRQKAISKSLNRKRESEAAPAITGKCYRMLLHEKRGDPDKARVSITSSTDNTY